MVAIRPRQLDSEVIYVWPIMSHNNMTHNFIQIIMNKQTWNGLK